MISKMVYELQSAMNSKIAYELQNGGPYTF
jgi:hypothetical protein